MGSQASYIKFGNKNDLIKALRKYQQRNTEDDLADIVAVAKAKSTIAPFEKGELTLLVVGERSAQRSLNRLKNDLGIEGAENIIFLDDFLFDAGIEEDLELEEFINRYFIEVDLESDEVEALLSS